MSFQTFANSKWRPADVSGSTDRDVLPDMQINCPCGSILVSGSTDRDVLPDKLEQSNMLINCFRLYR